MIDWTSSKVFFSPRGMAHTTNVARADVVSRVQTADDDILHGASCVGERTYADDGLLIDKRKFVFVPIFGSHRWRFVRRPATKRGATGGIYDRLDVRRQVSLFEAEPLDSISAVHNAATSGRSMSGRLVVDGGVIEFPVRTVNTEAERWQIDVGPILLPSPEGSCGLDNLRLGYLVASSLRPDIHVMSDNISRGWVWPRSRRHIYPLRGRIELFGDIDGHEIPNRR